MCSVMAAVYKDRKDMNLLGENRMSVTAALIVGSRDY